MSAEGSSFSEEVSNNMLKELQSWWEIPSMAQYISLFREPFHLPEIEIEELEKGFIDDTVKGPSEWLQTLLIAFLKSIMPGRVNAENWEDQLRKLVRRKWPESPYSEKPHPFEEDKPFHQLQLRSKVEVVYCFCLCRLDKNDIAEQMKSMDADALRVQKLGTDDAGNTYWYFYGTRLYKEEPVQEQKSWDEEWKEQKRKSFRKKRGRGRPRKRQPTSDGESDSEGVQKDSRYMNVNEKSRWSVVCDTIEEWVNFAEKFKTSKSKNEKVLFQIIQENFLPTLNQIYEEKERKLQQKIRDLMPALPAREKIVTRTETRRQRGDDVRIDYSRLNGYYSDDEEQDTYKRQPPAPPPVIKDRAQRLEERRKRASEANMTNGLPTNKKPKDDRNDESDEEISVLQIPEGREVDIQSEMERILTNVKLHKDAWPFLYPVDEEDAPGYYEIIKDPIDLSKIESKLYNGDYETIGDLDGDFSKMVSNCELYNGEYHAYSKMAQTLRKMFRKQVAKILESLETVESEHAHSEESRDSTTHSSSNSVSSAPESPPMRAVPSREHKKSKHKKRKRGMEALDLLAKAADVAVQDNLINRTSPPQKKSPEPQEKMTAPVHVPSTSMPFNPVSVSTTTSNRTSLQVASSNFKNPVVQFVKNRPVIITSKVSESNKTTSNSNIITTSLNSAPGNKNYSSTLTQNGMYQSSSPKTVPPIVISGFNSSSPSGQSNLRIKNPAVAMTLQSAPPAAMTMQSNPANAMTMQSNPSASTTMQSSVCMPNRLPVIQQVIIPAGSQQFQIPSNGQFVLASSQNTVGMYTKEQNVQMQNNVGQLNQNCGKVVPQYASVMPISKEGIQNLQFQTLTQSAQPFTQVSQNPQFVNIPYMLTNQNVINNPSSQSVMNLQPYQLTPRQVQVSSQGNG